MKGITIADVEVLYGSAHVEKLNKQKQVESLYCLYEEMELRGWSIDVNDYDYLGYLTIALSESTNSLIRNSQEEQSKFIKDLVECINNNIKEKNLWKR